MKAISGALIKEWAAFVLKEVKARQGLEGQLLQLHSEFGQIKVWLISQLDILRKEAKEGASEVVKEFNLRQLEMADNMNFQVLHTRVHPLEDVVANCATTTNNNKNGLPLLLLLKPCFQFLSISKSFCEPLFVGGEARQ